MGRQKEIAKRCYRKHRLSRIAKQKALGKRHEAAGLCHCGQRKPWKLYKECRTCRLKSRAASIDRNRRLKLAVIAGYGGKCVCCGEKHPDFLTIDHKYGKGNSHRKILYGKSRGGYTLYLWLVKHNFPKKKYQLLCWNCNCAKGSFGTCPHQRGEA